MVHFWAVIYPFLNGSFNQSSAICSNGALWKKYVAFVFVINDDSGAVSILNVQSTPTKYNRRLATGAVSI